MMHIHFALNPDCAPKMLSPLVCYPIETLLISVCLLSWYPASTWRAVLSRWCYPLPLHKTCSVFSLRCSRRGRICEAMQSLLFIKQVLAVIFPLNTTKFFLSVDSFFFFFSLLLLLFSIFGGSSVLQCSHIFLLLCKYATGCKITTPQN